VGHGWLLDGDVAGESTLTEHWDGTSWRVVPSPNDDRSQRLTDVAAVSSTDVWAVGDDASGLIPEHRDGTRWSIVRPPSPIPDRAYSSQLISVAALGSNDVWAAGWYMPRFTVHPLVEHWNGVSWSLVAAGHRPGANEQLTGVVAIGADDAWAVGSSEGRDLVEPGTARHGLSRSMPLALPDITG
jgi:hypothetical protein